MKTVTLTKEQRKISAINNEKAWIRLGYPDRKSRKGLVLHHIDTNLLYTNVDEYIKWEEVVVMTVKDHMTLHNKLRAPENSKRMKGNTPWNKGLTGCYSEESLKRFSEAQKGKKRSDETRRKISERNKGHIVTEETREKISSANSGEKNGMYGKKWSKESIEKRTATRKAKGTPCAVKGRHWKLVDGKHVYYD